MSTEDSMHTDEPDWSKVSKFYASALVTSIIFTIIGILLPNKILFAMSFTSCFWIFINCMFIDFKK